MSAVSEEPDPRAEPFGFACSRCSRCCYDKLIQLNPYETARLARNRGVSSTEFRDRFTRDGAGTHLATRADGACVFLGPEGCGVHSDRPLVCRLYPLGRTVWEDGREVFVRVTPHPQSEGRFHDDGTIGAFLDAQSAGPFMAAADAYLGWFGRARRALAEIGGDVADGLDALNLFDMDLAIEAHVVVSGTPEPRSMEDRLALHLDILDRALLAVSGGSPCRKDP